MTLEKRNIFLLVAVASILALAACAFAPKTPLPAGTVAPGFELQAGDQALTLDDYAGNVVVIAFWASP